MNTELEIKDIRRALKSARKFGAKKIARDMGTTVEVVFASYKALQARLKELEAH